MKSLFIDCRFGAAGDMLLGALLDLTAGGSIVPNGLLEPASLLSESLLPKIHGVIAYQDGASFSVKRVERAKVSGVKADFFVGDVHSDFHAGLQAPWSLAGHVTLSGIIKFIDALKRNGRISENAHLLSCKVFRILAEAEAAAHQSTVDKVHFHEVGAFDSVADVVCFSLLFELIEKQTVFSTPVGTGRGFVSSAHGRLSVPTPAVCEIIRSFNIPTCGEDLEGERLTPTGAAILAAIVDVWDTAPSFHGPAVSGVGAGSRDTPENPNVVRFELGLASPGA